MVNLVSIDFIPFYLCIRHTYGHIQELVLHCMPSGEDIVIADENVDVDEQALKKQKRIKITSQFRKTN